MTEKCPKCQREWKDQAPCDQTVCIEMFGECIPCRFLPTTHPNNTRGSGSGTDADLKAIEATSSAALLHAVAQTGMDRCRRQGAGT